MQVQRHRAAIRRSDFSRPVRLALNHGLIGPGRNFFDYGCGHGDDVRLLRKQGVESQGWDPHFRPQTSKVHADVVNLGYVLNVIEDARERARTLQEAWRLTGQVLLVSTLVVQDRKEGCQTPYRDGVVTRLGTFQKYFDHSELKEYLEEQLAAEVLPAALGVFFVFRDSAAAIAFRASRYRRRTEAARPRLPASVKRFQANRERLEALMDFVRDHGRVPERDELPEGEELCAEFGSLPRAFALVRRVTGKELWERAAEERRQELLVFLALSRFERRPRFSELPLALQRDLRKLFGAYKRACQEADRLLFKLGEPGVIEQLVATSRIGKHLPGHLYVHASALDELDPLLRMYEGCARSYIGAIEEANVIKFHTRRPAVSFLEYAEFDRDPHPTLLTSVKVNLAERTVRTRDYRGRENPPVLHRKETFLTDTYPHYAKFARLTSQEERLGLLEDPSRIGTRRGWEERLKECGYELRGHRVVRRKS